MQAQKNSTHLVIGLGEIGKPLFTLLSRAHPNYVGVDIEPVEVAGPVGMMHVCYPFLVGKGFVETTVAYIRKYHPAVVIINSTVVPGTTRSIAEAGGVPCVYSPVRGKHTRMEADSLFYCKFVAGGSERAVQVASEHFSAAGMKTKTMSSEEGLELAKLLETTYFGLLIAWAQEMDRFSRHLNVDYNEVASFFEEIAYLPPFVFQPGYIAGHCVMPNIALLKTHFHSEFLDAIERSNDKKAKELSSHPDKLRERIEPLPLRRL